MRDPVMVGGLRMRVLRLAVLALLLAAAAALRFSNINWDQFQHVHPDERFIVWVADSVELPADLGQALDPARSGLNPFRWPPTAGENAGKPRGYAYGHLPLYLLVVVANLAQVIGRWFGETTLAFPHFLMPLYTVGRHLTEYNYLPLVGRAISALSDLGTLVLVYGLGKRMGEWANQRISEWANGRMGESANGRISESANGRISESEYGVRSTQYGVRNTQYAVRNTQYAVGLLAAGAYAFAVLPIQLSHFYAVDMVLTFFVVATVALAARWARPPGARWAGVAAGAMAGLAVGSKFSAVLLIAPLAAAALIRSSANGEGRRPGALLGLLAGPLAAGAAVFALTNPFALIEWRAYLANILAQNAMVSGVMDAPYTRQYIGTVPYWYFVQQLSQWGLGWPLGAVAWGGLVWGIVRAVRRRAAPAEVVMLAWAVPYFATTGIFHAKFLRYMAPLLPFLLIFGADGALAARRWLADRWGGRGRVAWAAAAAVTAIVTVAWALAFTGVYRQEHPWIQASRWIYGNVPEGARLLTEHWDDALPLTLDEVPGRPPPRSYTRVELQLYDPDTAEKLDKLVAELSSGDYLVLASNRLYGPIGRLSRRYPMSSQYYRLLFSGELGYERVAEFTAYPQLGPIVVPDDHADESFTVYDHPRAMIFVNARRLSPSLLRARLGRYLPQGRAGTDALHVAGLSRPDAHAALAARAKPPRGTADENAHRNRAFRGSVASRGQPAKASSPERPSSVSGRRSSVGIFKADAQGGGRVPGHASYLPPGQAPAPDAPLTLSQPVDTLPVVADFRWNRLASEWAPLAVVLWWLAMSLFGWLAWPLLFPLMGGLADRGQGLARVAGWLLVGWVHWMGVSLRLWQNRLPVIAGLLGLLAACGLIAWRGQRRQMAEFAAAHRRLLLGQEALFALAFVGFVGIRLLNPDLWQPWNGGEKFMEFAFLNATLRSPYFPPYDPYFAGGIINYYYYGLYLVSLLVKLTGIVPEVAFNLAVPGLFALTALGLFSVAYTLARGRGGARAAGLAVGLALLLGNLAGARELFRAVGSLGFRPEHGQGLLGGLEAFGRGVLALARGASLPYDYWAPSRVIPYTINEFPLWTFLFADLHPHLIAMPLGMLVVGLALNWVLRRWSTVGGRPSAFSEQRWAAALRPALAFGATCLLVALALGALGPTNTWDLPTYLLLLTAAVTVAAWRGGRVRSLFPALAVAAAIGAAAVALYWPFYAHYQSQVGGGDGFVVGRYLGWVRAASPLGAWLLIWGFWTLLAYTITWLLWRRRRARAAVAQEAGTDEAGPLGRADEVVQRPRPVRVSLIGLLGLLALALVLAALGRITAALLVIPFALALVLAFQRRLDARWAFVALLLALGLGIVAGIEIIYLRDFLQGGDWYRMNTLFKFSVPAWLFLALAGGVALPQLRGASYRAPAWLGRSWRLIVSLLLAASLAFPIFGIPSRVRDRFPDARPGIGSLDGTEFMVVGRYTWPNARHPLELAYDYLAIHWLLDNVTGSPVIAEAPAGTYDVDGERVGYDYYRAGGLRVASLTGFPTFLGQHQYEQRPADQVMTRGMLGQEFFRTTDLERTRELLRELRVGYVYVGPLERILFTAESLGKFDALVQQGDLRVVYRNSRVTIYGVSLVQKTS